MNDFAYTCGIMIVTNEDAKSIVAQNVRRLAEKRGFTCRSLAAATGDNAMRISDVMRGAHEPKIGVLTRIAEALDTTVDYLITPSESQSEKNLESVA